jgi:hypothetical protein
MSEYYYKSGIIMGIIGILGILYVLNFSSQISPLYYVVIIFVASIISCWISMFSFIKYHEII